MWKVILALIVLGGSFAGGFWTGRGNKEVEIREVKTKGETIVKTVEKIRWKERIVHPDGTIVEREHEEDRDTKTHDKETVSEKDKSVRPTQSNYSLGIAYWASFREPLPEQSKGISYDAVELRVGRRIVGDFWIDLGYRLDRSLSLGVRAEF